jgi:hypothetical protein
MIDKDFIKCYAVSQQGACMTNQKCWDEVRKKSGISLADQSKKYQKAFTLWHNDITSKVQLASQIEVFEVELSSIAAASTILELQNVLIIRNVNEFQLRDHPTSREFAVILDDFRKWSLRIKNHIDGDRDAYLAWIEKVVAAAQQKFDSLRTQS